MTTLTVADYADTGQWRLIVNIHPGGMSAFLENTLHEDVDLQELFSTSWEYDPDTLLQQIENAVYDHPRVLDDFSARIVLYDRRTLFVPTRVIDENYGVGEEIFTTLYSGREEDVISETDGDITAVSSLAPGLKGFLSRTFPGARVATNLMNEVSRLRIENREGGKRMSVNVREQAKEADIILLDGSALISASTHTAVCEEDVIFHIYNVIDSYALNPAEVEIEDKYRL